MGISFPLSLLFFLLSIACVSALVLLVQSYRGRRRSLFINGCSHISSLFPVLITISIPDSYDTSIAIGFVLLVADWGAVVWVLMDRSIPYHISYSVISLIGFIAFLIAHIVFANMP